MNQKNIVFPLYPLLLFLNDEGFSQYTYWKKYHVSEACLFFSIHSKKPWGLWKGILELLITVGID